MRQSISFQRNRLSSIQQEKFAEPTLYLVVKSISDWIGHRNFLELFEAIQLASTLDIPLSDLFNQFKR